ncbi:hypothetical protein OHT20_35240 [Streptomyces caniferus]|uniref:hypothetical protein n=1 Tax=Streptomyces caniferus TaxID=285557 RepID=UPI002E288788|nr:hypothetical protein [Streptomyces caniferus]
MGSAISREASGDRSQQKKPKPARGWRVTGLLLGLVIAFAGADAVLVSAVHGVQATGLVGTRGTFTVDYCTDTNPSRKNSDYECGGVFVPRGGVVDDGWHGRLENADDYPAGEKLDVVETWLGSDMRFREVGVGAALASVMWLCFGLVILAMGAFQVRKWAKSFKK